MATSVDAGGAPRRTLSQRRILAETSSDSVAILSTPPAGLPPLSPRVLSETTAQYSDFESSTMSTRSTSLPSVRSASSRLKRMSSSLFLKKKKKTPMEMHASIVTAALANDDGSLLGVSITSTGDEVSGISVVSESSDSRVQARDHDLLRGLEAIAVTLKRMEASVETLKQESASDSRGWALKSATVLLAAVALSVLSINSTENVWLFIALVAFALFLGRNAGHTNSSITIQKDLESVLREIDTLKLLFDHEHSAVMLEPSVIEPSPKPADTSVTRDRATSYEFGDNSFNKDGYRLNCFAGLDNLDFEKHVFSVLDSEHQAIFLEFEKKFKEAFNPSNVEPFNIPDRFTLLRFLQADKYDLEKGLGRILKTISWRREYEIDAFMENPDWQLLRRGEALRPRVFCGFDKNHRPLLVEKLGEFFGSDEAFRGISFPEWIKVYTFQQGQITNYFRTAVRDHGGPYQHRLSFIGDLQGLRFIQATRLVPFLKMLVKEVETHWPEFAGIVALVNAPPIVSKLFGIVRKFLDPSVSEKVVIYSGDCSKQLIEKFGAESLPVELGGMNPVKLPSCPRKVTDEFNAKYPYTPIENA